MYLKEGDILYLSPDEEPLLRCDDSYRRDQQIDKIIKEEE